MRDMAIVSQRRVNAMVLQLCLAAAISRAARPPSTRFVAQWGTDVRWSLSNAQHYVQAINGLANSGTSATPSSRVLERSLRAGASYEASTGASDLSQQSGRVGPVGFAFFLVKMHLAARGILISS